MVDFSKILLNGKGERIEKVGEIWLNLEYWDCECNENYIHSTTQNKCSICLSIQEDSPNSRKNEVEKYFNRAL